MPDATPDPDLLEQSREHAWEWFALHATQRMQGFNFFLVAIGFIIAAYASVITKDRAVAFGVALLGAWITIWFNRLDLRCRELIKAGETALALCEGRLAQRAAAPSLRLVDTVERPGRFIPSYTSSFKAIQGAILMVAFFGAAFALVPKAWYDNFEQRVYYSICRVYKAQNDSTIRQRTPFRPLSFLEFR